MPTYEDKSDMKSENLDLERARMSVVEELEAIGWYQERADATKNEKLNKILEHNMNEEKEHVAMLLEWIRENDPIQDKKFGEHD